jgi:ABC-type multidrug transport system fused ATPase/permease subunit
MLLAYVAQALARVAMDLWLAWWSDGLFPELSTADHAGVFAALTGGAVVMSLARSAGLTAAALRAASALHARGVTAVLRAPISFFDATPAGRIVNRFSRDQSILDAEIPTALQFAGELMAGTIASACVCAALLPEFSACALPLALCFRATQRRYAPLSRDAKRLEAAARSPLLSAAAAAAAAAPAVRACGAASAFAADFAAAQDAHNRAHWAFVAAGRWLGSRLDVLAAAAVATAAACVAGSRGRVEPGLAGMALVSSLAFTGQLQYAVRQLSELENLFTSVERLVAYTKLASEAAADSAPGTLPPDWPAAGGLELEKLTVAYHPGAPPALRSISLSVPPGTKLAVLGRTGSGKSTLAAALFRLVENDGCSGCVRIDGVDIRSVGLDDLRSRIALIPQEAVLFAGTLRDNLDPFGAASALDVAALLPRLGLAGRAGGLGLDAPLSEGGDNLSAGERALVCLGRALLRRSRVLVCDEATAAVDADCDARIQAAIRADFAACTVVTIAHRLATIIDADAVAVLVPGGTLAESGEPDELLRTAPQGPFAAMVAATGPAHAAALTAAARDAALRRRKHQN